MLYVGKMYVNCGVNFTLSLQFSITIEYSHCLELSATSHPDIIINQFDNLYTRCLQRDWAPYGHTCVIIKNI